MADRLTYLLTAYGAVLILILLYVLWLGVRVKGLESRIHRREPAEGKGSDA